MTAAELVRELESFQSALDEHRRLWGDSLDSQLPDRPVDNVDELRVQCRSLSRTLGFLRPYLERLRSSWVIGASGVSWNVLDEAVRVDQAAAIKGPALDALIEALDQVIGQLQGLPADSPVGQEIELLAVSTTPEQLQRPANGRSDDEAQRTDRLLQRIRNHPYVSLLVVFGTIVIAISSFTEAASKIVNMFSRSNASIERRELQASVARAQVIQGDSLNFQAEVILRNRGTQPDVVLSVRMVWGPDLSKRVNVLGRAPKGPFTLEPSQVETIVLEESLVEDGLADAGEPSGDDHRIQYGIEFYTATPQGASTRIVYLVGTVTYNYACDCIKKSEKPLSDMINLLTGRPVS